MIRRCLSVPVFVAAICMLALYRPLTAAGPATPKRPKAIDAVSAGNTLSEREHEVSGKKTNVKQGEKESAFGSWREIQKGGWFSYEMKVDPELALVLLCTFKGTKKGNPLFDVFVNDKKIGNQSLKARKPDKPIRATFTIPGDLVKDRDKIVVKFKARGKHEEVGLLTCEVRRSSPKLFSPLDNGVRNKALLNRLPGEPL